LFSPFLTGKEPAEQLENLGAYLSQDPKRIENIRSHPATIAHYSQQDMHREIQDAHGSGIEAEQLDGILFQNEWPHLRLDGNLLKIGQPAIGGDERVIGTEEYLVLEQCIGILD